MSGGSENPFLGGMSLTRAEWEAIRGLLTGQPPDVTPEMFEHLKRKIGLPEDPVLFHLTKALEGLRAERDSEPNATARRWAACAVETLQRAIAERRTAKGFAAPR